MAKRTQTIPSPFAVAEAFAAGVYQLPGVEGVYVRDDAGQTLHLWTVVRDDDLRLREQLYGLEADLCTAFPGARLDFFVVATSRLKDGG